MQVDGMSKDELGKQILNITDSYVKKNCNTISKMEIAADIFLVISNVIGIYCPAKTEEQWEETFEIIKKRAIELNNDLVKATKEKK